jgi:hypothetical protein
MADDPCDTILKATLEVAKSVEVGSRFQASMVRKHLRRPSDQGKANPIRRCWEQNRDWLKNHGLRLVEEQKKVLTYYYLQKEGT